VDKREHYPLCGRYLLPLPLLDETIANGEERRESSPHTKTCDGDAYRYCRGKVCSDRMTTLVDLLNILCRVSPGNSDFSCGYGPLTISEIDDARDRAPLHASRLLQGGSYLSNLRRKRTVVCMAVIECAIDQLTCVYLIQCLCQFDGRL
jgi:hypothetical protein